MLRCLAALGRAGINHETTRNDTKLVGADGGRFGIRAAGLYNGNAAGGAAV